MNFKAFFVLFLAELSSFCQKQAFYAFSVYNIQCTRITHIERHYPLTGKIEPFCDTFLQAMHSRTEICVFAHSNLKENPKTVSFNTSVKQGFTLHGIVVLV